MTRRASDTQSTAHTKSVTAIMKAAQSAWQAVTKLQAEDSVNPDGVFAEDRNGSMHPQKESHARLMGYHNLLANKTYWIGAAELWQEPLKLETGDPYQAVVPASKEVTVGDNELRMQDLETKRETISLETLSHRWAMRYITVNRTKKGSWGSENKTVQQKRVWLPPRAIMLAFDRLEEVRAKINMGADLDTPDWRAEKVLDPTEGVRDPYGDQ